MNEIGENINIRYLIYDHNLITIFLQFYLHFQKIYDKMEKSLFLKEGLNYEKNKNNM